MSTQERLNAIRSSWTAPTFRKKKDGETGLGGDENHGVANQATGMDHHDHVGVEEQHGGMDAEDEVANRGRSHLESLLYRAGATCGRVTEESRNVNSSRKFSENFDQFLLRATRNLFGEE